MFRKTVRSRISPESVMREEESLWWEEFVRQVGFKPGMKDWGSYGWGEWRIRGRWCENRHRKTVMDGYKQEVDSREKGEAYRKERSVIRNKDDVGGRARATMQRWRASAARKLNSDEITQIWRLGGCNKFFYVSDRNLHSVPMDWIARWGALTTARAREFWDLLEASY